MDDDEAEYHRRMRRGRKRRRREVVMRSMGKRDEQDEDDGDSSSDSSSSSSSSSSGSDRGDSRRREGVGDDDSGYQTRSCLFGCPVTVAIPLAFIFVAAILGAIWFFKRDSLDSSTSSSSGSGIEVSSSVGMTASASASTSKTSSEDAGSSGGGSDKGEGGGGSSGSASHASSGGGGAGGTSSASGTASASAPDSSSSSSSTSSGDGDQSALTAMGISTFLGNNTGGIASWYNTDASSDSTNGRSWCEFPYDNTVPGFAPSLKTMLASFNQDSAAAKTGFCGLEAQVYSPKTGTTTTLIIADAFDDTWVLTPASIDVIKGSFAAVFGSDTDNKQDVAKDVSWVLTGNRNDKFTYKGVGVG